MTHPVIQGAAAANPTANADSYFHEGLALFNAGKYVKAIDLFNKAIALDPNQAIYWDRRGTAYFGLSNYSQAMKDHTQAINLDPNNGFYYSERALDYYAMGAMNDSIKDFKTGAKLGDASCQAVLNHLGIKW